MSLTKYHAKRTDLDGIIFASKKEARRYGELRRVLQLLVFGRAGPERQLVAGWQTVHLQLDGCERTHRLPEQWQWMVRSRASGSARFNLRAARLFSDREGRHGTGGRPW